MSRRGRSARALAIAAIAGALATAAAAQGCSGASDDGSARGGGGAHGRPGRELREIVLRSAPAEDDRPTLFAQAGPTLREVGDRIAAARDDREAAGLFVRVEPMGGAWARVSDLRDALDGVRRAHKPVHCYFETADNASYMLLASACDVVTMAPAGDLELVGPAAQLFYARDLLERIGVRADLLQIGRFKGAADAATRSEMPPETRAAMGAILDDLFGALVRGVAAGRRLPRPRVRALVDEGPFDSSRAVRARLVDHAGFDDEARARAKRAARADRVVKVALEDAPHPIDLAELLRTLGASMQSSGPEAKPADHIVLARLTGTILDGDSGAGGARSGPFVAAMRALRGRSATCAPSCCASTRPAAPRSRAT